jgi:RNA polymerase sigma-70 factor (ECF subfamily)
MFINHPGLKKQEQEQLKLIQCRDHPAFRKIFEEYYSPLTVFAQKFVPDLDLAREIVQDMFVNLYEKSDSLNIQTSLKSYLYQSVRNSCLNIIKKEKVHLSVHAGLRSTSGTGEADWTDKMIEAELQNLVFRTISELPGKCRQIYLLSRQEGISNREIAQKLNISIRTVETQVSKALKILRSRLGPYLAIFCLIICL